MIRFGILSIFPLALEQMSNFSILQRARQNNLISFDMIDIRNFSTSKHKNTDDYPYGGGAGMLMSVQPIDDAFKYTDALGYTGKKILLSPRGQVFNQNLAKQLSQEKDIRFLCGHYEGVDQRAIDKHIDMEISLGDFVLTGGELAVMVIIDAVSRLVKGVLGDINSTEEESFSNSLLEYPQYTRPAVYDGMAVPEVLLSGNHALIAKWRREQSLLLTYKQRPDLLKSASLTKSDIQFLQRLKEQEND